LLLSRKQRGNAQNQEELRHGEKSPKDRRHGYFIVIPRGVEQPTLHHSFWGKHIKSRLGADRCCGLP
jgi:hypothetical protein